MPARLLDGSLSRIAPISVFVALCLIGNSWWTIHNISQLVDATLWVERRSSIQLDVARIETDLVNAETGQRGYVLTGQPEYLEPYHAGIRYAGRRMEVLRELAAYDPDLVQRLDALDAAVQSKFAEMRTVIRLMESRGQLVAQQSIAAGQGKAIMDDVRQIVEAIYRSVAADLQNNTNQVAHARTSVLLALTVFVLGTLTLIGMLYLTSRRELVRKAKDAAEISQYAQSLKGSMSELRRERNEVQSLIEAAGYMQSCDSIPELVRLLKPTLEQLFSGFAGHVYLHAASRNRLDGVVSFGGAAETAPMAPTDCWALRRGQDHLYTLDNGAPACTHCGSHQAEVLCVPLIAHGDTIGLLMLMRQDLKSEGNSGIDIEDARRLSHMVGTQLALTFANLKLQDSLRQQAITDPLTQAFNRRYLDAIGDKILAQANRFNQHLAVAMLDVDHFKQYNDLHGHIAGDHVLTSVAQFMQTHIREADWLFRYGGEEFLIILQGSSAQSAREKLDAMREAIAGLQFTNADIVLPGVTVSIGCAFYPEDETGLLELIHLADEALYRAKAAGRNRVCLHQSETISVASKSNIVSIAAEA